MSLHEHVWRVPLDGDPALCCLRCNWRYSFGEIDYQRGKEIVDRAKAGRADAEAFLEALFSAMEWMEWQALVSSSRRRPFTA